MLRIKASVIMMILTKLTIYSSYEENSRKTEGEQQS